MPSPKHPFDAVMHIDGGARGNPGPAACGVVVAAADGAPVDSLSQYLGETTNNVAEYRALLAALEYALEHRYSRLKVVSDSELLVRQMQGHYKVKSADLKPLHEQARRLVGRLAAFSIEHVRREANREADRLVNEALDAVEGRRALPARRERDDVLRATATYQRGLLRLNRQLPLDEGEDVEIEVRRKR
jgi:probable phosphoglycerate mutase